MRSEQSTIFLKVPHWWLTRSSFIWSCVSSNVAKVKVQYWLISCCSDIAEGCREAAPGLTSSKISWVTPSLWFRLHANGFCLLGLTVNTWVAVVTILEVWVHWSTGCVMSDAVDTQQQIDYNKTVKSVTIKPHLIKNNSVTPSVHPLPAICTITHR